MRWARSVLAASFILSATVMAAGPAAGQAPMLMRGRGPMRGLEDGLRLPLLLQGARLTPDQEAQVQTIVNTHRATTRPLIDQLRQAQDELTDKLIGPGAVQAADLQPSLQRIAQLRDQLLQERVRIGLEVRAILTTAQLGQAAQAKDRLRAWTTGMRQLMQPASP